MNVEINIRAGRGNSSPQKLPAPEPRGVGAYVKPASLRGFNDTIILDEFRGNMKRGEELKAVFTASAKVPRR